jgi:hypothetical protein
MTQRILLVLFIRKGIIMAKAEVNKQPVKERPLYLPPLLKTLPPE